MFKSSISSSSNAQSSSLSRSINSQNNFIPEEPSSSSNTKKRKLSQDSQEVSKGDTIRVAAKGRICDVVTSIQELISKNLVTEKRPNPKTRKRMKMKMSKT